MIKKTFYYITILFYYILGLWILEFIPYFKKNFLPLWRFINKMFISNASILFTSFVLPMIFMLILGSFMQVKQIFPGVIAQIAIIVLCVNIPMLLVNFRRSSVLKRLAASNIKNKNILLAFVLYGFLVSIISTLILFLLTIMVFGNTTKPAIGKIENQIAFIKHISKVNWLSFIFSFFLLLILASGIGILVARVSKNEMVAMALGLVVLIPGGFLSSQYLDPVIILKTDELDYASYIFWQKYPTNLMIASFDGHNIFGLEDYIITTKSFSQGANSIVKKVSQDYQFLNSLQKIAYISGSVIVGPLLFIISLKTFRWTNR